MSVKIMAEEGQLERDESVLIERIKAGEKELFHELISPYEHGLFLTVKSILKNDADAEEVAQEAILKAFAHLDQLRSGEKFKSWLLLIAVNEARMRRRKERSHSYESLDGEGTHNEEGGFMPRQFADWRELPSEIVERKEIRSAVRQALDRMPEIYREVFVLRDMQHLNVAETASALGISQPAVKTRLHRARLHMREQLAPLFARRWTDRMKFWKGTNPW